MKNLSKVLLFFTIILLHSCSDSNDDLNLNNSSANTSGSTGNNGTGSNGSGTNNSVGSDGDITLYRVQGENIFKIVDYQVSGQNLVYQQDTQEHQKLWRLVKKIIPVNHRTKISEFLIYNGDVNNTNGISVQINNDLSKWKLGLAINNSKGDQQKLIYTIVHEFGHILTLNNSQINSMIRENNCTNFYSYLGCSKNNSYINKFQNQFWSGIWDSFLVAQDSGSLGIQSFYNTYNNHFLTSNSAVNPGEDIADVFATFVTRKNNSNGNSITEQKIQFMYNYSELVSLRNYIRTNLGATSGG